MNSLSQPLQAASTQGRVIHALIMREMKSRFGRQKLGYLWAVFEPAAFVASFALIFSYSQRAAPSGMPVVAFMITGFAPFILFRSLMTQSMGAIENNRVLLTFPQVTLLDLVLARAILETATMTLVFVLLLVVAELLGFEIRIDDPLGVLLMLACLALTGFGLGATLAAIAPFVRSLQQIVSIFAGRPLFFVSGLFFTAEMLPNAFREILLFNPILHMIEGLRSAFFHQFDSSHVSMEFALGTALTAACFGLLMLRGLKKRILSAV